MKPWKLIKILIKFRCNVYEITLFNVFFFSFFASTALDTSHFLGGLCFPFSIGFVRKPGFHF